MQLSLSGLLNLTGTLLPLNLPSFWRSPHPSSGGVVPLSPGQFDEFVPYLEFARAAYCEPEIITGWQCGGQLFSFLLLLSFYPLDKLTDGAKGACRAVPDFEPTLTGGDGDSTQYCKRDCVTVSSPRPLTYDGRLCWVLAYPVCRGGSTPRHRPVASVCPLLSFSPVNA